jgi:hypothetical protein
MLINSEFQQEYIEVDSSTTEVNPTKNNKKEEKCNPKCNSKISGCYKNYSKENKGP